MEQPEGAASQLSECGSVLDLSCTYNISNSLHQQGPTSGTWEEDSSCALTSASPSSSLNNSGYTTNHCDSFGKTKQEGYGISSALSPNNSSSIVKEQRNSIVTTSPKPETRKDSEDTQIRTDLDAFYELSSRTGENAYSHHLSEKISELKQKNCLYSLRSFQVAKIILLYEGTKVLQNSKNDNVFSSTGEKARIKPVPGLSDDVVRFLIDRKSAEEGT